MRLRIDADRTGPGPVRPAPHGSAGAEWRLKIPEERRRHLRTWLWSGIALTFLIVIVGGITRLTQSGLSIVEWQPVTGVIPPLSEGAWEEYFARYRESPEYQKLRQGMTLADFRFIFFWEYFHRLLARLVGVVFLVPFLFFWSRGYLNPPLRRRVLVLFGLGALQGVMGWFMVRSGLVDHPHVSHYRLAAHLSIALAILGLALWLVRELSVDRDSGEHRAVERTTRWMVYGLGALLLIQIIWGAFVAGLDAGLYYNTFPLMDGGWSPPGGLELSSAVRDLVENPVVVQWVHRVLGTLLLLGALHAAMWSWRTREDRTATRLSFAFAAMVVAQYALGVATLLFFVPVSLGVLHQAAAVVLFGCWIVWLHHVRNRRGTVARAGSGRAAPMVRPRAPVP